MVWLLDNSNKNVTSSVTEIRLT